MNEKSISAETLWLALWRTFHAVRKNDEQSIAATGLCLSDFAILETLFHQGEQSIQDIASRVLLTSGSMTAAANRLYEKGLIQRRSSKKDKRMAYLSLLPPGRQLMEHHFPEHARRLSLNFDTLTNQEKKKLFLLLGKVRKNAHCQKKKHHES